MSKIACGLVGLCLCLHCIPALGQESETRKWKEEAELAFVNTSGNSEVLTIAAKNVLEYRFTPQLKGDWRIGALKGQTDGEVTAERYFSDLRLDFNSTDRFYLYLLGGWLKDRFAGIDQRYNIGPGVGYRFFVGPKNFLQGEAGLNYTHEKYVISEKKDFIEGRTFGEYKYAFSTKNLFIFSIEYLHDFNESENFKINSEAAVIAGLTDVLALKVAYAVRYQNQPIPAFLRDTDTILSASFIISY